MKHAAATGGALINKKYHFDAVRVGIGLYGLWPSKELEVQLGDKLKLQPVLSWRTRISEIKKLKAGDYVGYDLTERVPRATTMAILPIGYWHGVPRVFSGGGAQIIVRGKRIPTLGRVSMDMLFADLSQIPQAVVGSGVAFWGNQIPVDAVAEASGTVGYELLCAIAQRVPFKVINRNG